MARLELLTTAIKFTDCEIRKIITITVVAPRKIKIIMIETSNKPTM